jgi:ATP-dependent exoDNAse (exonuclease V) beta subunit
VKLGRYLTERGIPCIITKNEDAFALPEIATLNNFLFAAANPTNDLMLVLTMLNPVFNFTSDDAAQIKISSRSARKENYIDFIKKYIAVGADSILKNKLIKFNEVLIKYNAIIREKTVGETLETFITEYDYPRTKNVNAFLNKIKKMTAADSVARYLYLCEHKLLKLEISTGGTDEEAVHIMTMHKSKGLEFSAVVLFNMGDQWAHRVGGKKGLIAIDKKIGLCVISADADRYVKADNIITKGAEKLLEQNRLSEKMRLLYVAMTRPKKYLYIVGSCNVELKEKETDDAKCMLDLIYKGIRISPYQLHIVDIADVKNTRLIPLNKTVINNEVQRNSANDVYDERLILQDTGKSNIFVKQSVTSLTASERKQAEDATPLMFDNIENGSAAAAADYRGGAEYGTSFHTKMQYADTADKDAAEAAEIINKFLTGQDINIYKEIPFLTTVEKDGNDIMVQGIIDLLAIKDSKAIIIDYKTTRANEKRLIELYTPQLKMYAEAVQKFLPNYNIETYIYSTRLKKIVKI